MTTTIPTYTVGQRVVVNGVAGHFIKALRDGGPGVVQRVYSGGAIVLPDALTVPDCVGAYYAFSEIKPEPSI